MADDGEPRGPRDEDDDEAEEAERGRRAALDFPFELVETTGLAALDVWRKLKAKGPATPVVLGGPGDLWRIAERLRWRLERGETVEAVLAAAGAIDFPDDLYRRSAEERARVRALRMREAEAGRGQGWDPKAEWPPSGPWPERPFEEEPLSVALGWDLGGAPGTLEAARRTPLAKVYIALLPTDDASEAPAWLHWGGWNEVPESAMLVAALRSWRDRFGAELVGISHDAWSVKVDRPPTDRYEGLRVAREMLALCVDLIDGVDTLQGQAALAIENDWWSFWWD